MPLIEGGGVLRFEETASTIILGISVELGRVRRDVGDFEVRSSSPVPERPGMFHVEIGPVGEKPAVIQEMLLPKKPPAVVSRGRKKRKRMKHRR